jgi:hypothetical protein
MFAVLNVTRDHEDADCTSAQILPRIYRTHQDAVGAIWVHAAQAWKDYHELDDTSEADTPALPSINSDNPNQFFLYLEGLEQTEEWQIQEVALG